MSSSTTSPTAVVDVTMPQLGVSVSEGTVVAWRKRPGDAVAYEETICEIATDKIDVECPAPAAGVVAELLAREDETVPVGTVIARIAVEGETPGPPSPEPSPPTPAPDPIPAPIPPGPDPPVIEEPSRRAGGGFVSPVVARVAAEHGIDPARLEGTGRGGRVTKRDVLRAAEDPRTAGGREAPLHTESPYRPELDDDAAPAASPAATGPEGEPLSRMRRLIGEHMRRSLDTAAHCTTIAEADMTAVEARRTALGTTYLPVVARQVVEALREHPALNAWLAEDRLVRHDAVHLGIAVDLGPERGLIVPVIRDAQRLSDEGLAAAIADAAERARAGRLDAGELEGGTFTITNPGALGALAATPVIHLPQVAILDLEAVVKRPVVVAGPDGADAIAIRPMTHLCLSWDHRALDGAEAARFLRTLRARLEGAHAGR